MPREIATTDGVAFAKPTLEVRLNGRALDIGAPAANWPDTLRQVAKAVAFAAMERALAFGEENSATIEVWDTGGRLLVAVSAHVQAVWPGRAAEQGGQRGSQPGPIVAANDARGPCSVAP